MKVRAPLASDADKVAAFLAECDTIELGAPDTDAEDLRDQWSLPGFDPAQDAWVVEIDGRLAGYAYAWAREGKRIHAEARVHPDVGFEAAGPALLDRLEARTREHGIGVASVMLIGSNSAAARVAEARGYRLARHYLRMVAELDESQISAAPAGVTIRTLLGEEDERTVYELMMEAFAEEYEFVGDTYDAWRKRLVEVPSFDRELWFLAEAAGEVVGAAQCYPFLDGGWVQGLGVAPAWRGRGVGSALLAAAFRAFGERGRKRVALEVDAENPTDAKRLYERVGMREAFRFDLYEKDLATL